MFYRTMRKNQELISTTLILDPAKIQLSLIFLSILVSLAAILYEIVLKYKEICLKHKITNLKNDQVAAEHYKYPIDCVE